HKFKREQQEAAILAVRHQREAAFREYKIKEEVVDDRQFNTNVKLAYEAVVKRFDAVIEAEKLKLEELKLFDSHPQSEMNRAKADVAAKEAGVDLAEFALKECA